MKLAGTDDEMLTSNHINNDNQLHPKFVRGDDNGRMISDRDRITVSLPFEYMTEMNIVTISQVSARRAEVLAPLKEFLTECFSDYNNYIFQQMLWYDPKNWLPQSDNGRVNIVSFCDYFETPLLAQGMQRSQVIKKMETF